MRRPRINTSSSVRFWLPDLELVCRQSSRRDFAAHYARDETALASSMCSTFVMELTKHSYAASLRGEARLDVALQFVRQYVANQIANQTSSPLQLIVVTQGQFTNTRMYRTVL